MPGQYFDFEGFTHPTAFHSSSVGIVLKSQQFNSVGHPLHLRLGCIVESVQIEWNFQDGSLIRHITNFAQANALPLVEVSETQIDTSMFTPNPICGASLQGVLIDDTTDLVDIATDSAITEIPNVVSATLTLNSNNQTRVNSSTNCATARECGIVDAEFSFVEQSHVRPFNLGEQTHLRVVHSDGLAWNLRGMMYVNRSDFRVDIETGAIIQQTNNFSLKARIDGTDTTPDPDVPETAIGYISRPGEEPVQSPPRSPAWPLPWWPNQYVAQALTP